MPVVFANNEAKKRREKYRQSSVMSVEKIKQSQSTQTMHRVSRQRDRGGEGDRLVKY